MRYNAFYLRDKTLVIRIKDLETTSNKMIEDICVLYNKDDVIAYNFFNVDIDLAYGKQELNNDLHDYINKRLKAINHQGLELDLHDYFVVGYVKECNKHKDSNKLNVCKVDIKDDTLQIVCGASNVKEDIKVVVAKVGAVLKDGTWLKKGKLMGVESNGMICSSKELGLSEESNGILILEDTYNIGDAFVA